MLHVWNIYLDLPNRWHSFVGTYSIHGAFYGIFSSHDVPCTCFFSGGWVGFGFFANFSIATRNIVEPLPYCCTSLWTRFLYMDGSVFMEKSRWKWMICGYPPWRRTPQNGRFGFLFFSFVFSARKAGFQDIFFSGFLNVKSQGGTPMRNKRWMAKHQKITREVGCETLIIHDFKP